MEQEKRKVSVLFMLFGTLFCVCLITANVLETKQLSFGPVNLTAGIIVFPVSYIINDVVCEVWGYQRTRMLIWMGFAMNFFFVIMGAIADWIPGELLRTCHLEYGVRRDYRLHHLLPLGTGWHHSLGGDAVIDDFAGDAEDALRNPGIARHHPCGRVHEEARPRGRLR